MEVWKDKTGENCIWLSKSGWRMKFFLLTKVRVWKRIAKEKVVGVPFPLHYFSSSLFIIFDSKIYMLTDLGSLAVTFRFSVQIWRTNP